MNKSAPKLTSKQVPKRTAKSTQPSKPRPTLVENKSQPLKKAS